MIETGTILQNRYRIEKHIGQGGMGKVYVASDERFNSTVAIKETVFEDKNLRKAFEREARLLNSLKHQALPRVSDHFTEGDGQFLVMEFIAGEDLAEMMERNGEAFPLEDVLNWAKQLSDALHYLHTQDIIHRDIKPQNLKLTPKGQIVLLDFGLAKGSPTDAPQQTAAKSIFGYSRSYASLEQIQGTGTEPRSDLYSLGATLYHLLTGIPPADALTRAMNVLNGQNDPLISAHLVNNKVPLGVAEVLRKAMALNANERPVSALLMQEILDASDKNISENINLQNSPPSFTADLFTQETKIKPATTNVPLAVTDSPFKTKIAVDDAESKVTKIRSDETIKAPKQARKIGAIAFGGLLLAGTVFSAVYFLDSGSHENNSNQAVKTNGNSVFVITAPEDKSFSNSNAVNESVDLVQGETMPQTPVAPKTNQSIKTQSQTSKSQTSSTALTTKSKKTANSDDEMIINGDTIETKKMIIDENGVRMKVPPGRFPGANNMPPVPPNTYQGLSPEQLRQLRELRKMKPRVIIVNSPTPKPTP